jgi:hypothetical protein
MGSVYPTRPLGSTYVLVGQATEEALLQGALKGARRAREGVLILLPEGYFLFPGEKGRPVYSKPPGLERALLLDHGLRLAVVRGHETPRFAGE